MRYTHAPDQHLYRVSMRSPRNVATTSFASQCLSCDSGSPSIHNDLWRDPCAVEPVHEPRYLGPMPYSQGRPAPERGFDYHTLRHYANKGRYGTSNFMKPHKPIQLPAYPHSQSPEFCGLRSGSEFRVPHASEGDTLHEFPQSTMKAEYKSPRAVSAQGSRSWRSPDPSQRFGMPYTVLRSTTPNQYRRAFGLKQPGV